MTACQTEQNAAPLTSELLKAQLLADAEYLKSAKAYNTYQNLSSQGMITADRKITTAEYETMYADPMAAKEVYRAAGYEQWENIGQAFFDAHTSGEEMKKRYTEFVTALGPEDFESVHAEILAELGLTRENPLSQ